MKIPTIKEVKQLEGKFVLVRGSLNMPIKDGEVSSMFRINRLLPTLQFLQQAGAKTILVGHIGRDVNESFEPAVLPALKSVIEVTWGGAITDKDFAERRSRMKNGDILLVENLRRDVRETQNDKSFIELLAAAADLYVNEAFSNSHREHASMVGVPKHLPAYAGLNVERELTELSSMLKPSTPALCLIGGAKFETKLPLIKKLLKAYDHIFVGGALANDLLKARGYEVGTSLLSDIKLPKSMVEDEKLLLPVDLTVTDGSATRICGLEEVKETESIKDAGPETVKMLLPYIENAKSILWNGPFGEFEAGFDVITKGVARLVAESEAHSVVGGGDTVTAIEDLALNDKFGFLSTGGGAMLVYLEEGSLPAIDVLKG